MATSQQVPNRSQQHNVVGIKQLSANLKGLDLRALALRIFDDGYIQDYIVELNTDKQLRYGMANTGEYLRPEYASEEYAEGKQHLNNKPPTWTPDLYLEGDFYSGWVAELKGHLVRIYSTDEKSDGLEEKYEGVFGLTPDNFEKLIDEAILPELQTIILNELLR